MTDLNQLTNEFLARVLHISRTVNRQKAKTYCERHGLGGTAADLDRVLNHIAQHAEREQIESLATAEQDREQREAVEMKRRADETAEQEREVRDEAIGDAARKGAKLAVIELVGPVDWWDSWSTELRDMTIDNVDRARVEQYLDLSDFEGRDSVDAADVRSYVATAWADACLQQSIEECAALAKPGARWSVMTYYRKTMTPDRNCGEILDFDDRDDAVRYLQLAHDPEGNKFSSYSTVIVDSQPAVDDESQEEQEDE